MTEIIPAIMPKSFGDLKDKLSLVAQYVDTVQIDVMDGKFVKSRSWPYYASDRTSFQNLLTESEGLPYWDTLDFEIDLMVSKPEDVVDDWITAGASRLIIHAESTDKMGEIIRDLHERFAYTGGDKRHDIELGIALNPETPIDVVLPYLEDIQFVQFMGITKIGFQGEPLDERVFDKIREFHNAHPEIIVSVDGGVTLDNAHELIEAGAKRLVSGSAIFESENIAGVIGEFKRVV